jgi:hypothetical protein
MKAIAIIILFFSTSMTSNAQDDFLEPRGTYGIYGGYLFDYYNRIFTHLQPSTDRSLLRFMILPEFEPERILYLEHYDSSRYKLCLRRNVVNNRTGPVENYKQIEHKSFIISTTFAEIILAIYKSALQNTRFPIDEKIELSGTLYLFTARDSNNVVRYAEKWNPDPNSLMGRFIALSTKFIDRGFSLPSDYYHNDHTADFKDLGQELVSLHKEMQIKNSAPNLRPSVDNRHREYYKVGTYINATRDTIQSTKYEHEYSKGIYAVKTRIVEYYVLDSTTELWNNITTGNGGNVFVPDERIKKRFFKRKTIRWAMRKVPQKGITSP